MCNTHPAWFWQNETDPLSLFFPYPIRFRSPKDGSDLCKTGPDSIWFWLTVSGFWPNRSGPEASRCARIIRPISGQCFPADPDRMRHVYWDNLTTGRIRRSNYGLIACSIPGRVWRLVFSSTKVCPVCRVTGALTKELVF